MKKIVLLTFLALMTLTLASCNWDPTGVGTGGGTGGGSGSDSTKVDRDHDKKDRDGMMVRGMEGDAIKTPCDYYFTVESIVVTENASDVVTDKKQVRTIAVTIVVTNADGSVETYTLTEDAPSVTIGDCTIHLKGVKPMKTAGSDRVSHVGHFAITTGK
ncbi:MAG: hypothetical protein RIF34_05675 [Candidatus Kapaibacterium sp.]